MVDQVMRSSLSSIHIGEQHILLSCVFPKAPFKGTELLCFKVGSLHEKKYLEDTWVISIDLFSRLSKVAYSGFIDGPPLKISHDGKSVKIDSATFTLIDIDVEYSYVFLEGTKEDPLKIRKTKKEY